MLKWDVGFDLIHILLFLIPPYVANAAPVVLGGGAPIDLGRRTWDGRRILGDGKTIRGLVAGLVAGFTAGFVEAYAVGEGTLLTIAILSSCGAMAGDIIGSFVKRRLNVERGRPSLVMDQLLFIVLAIACAYPVLSVQTPDILLPESVLFILLFTYVMHRAMNIVANRMGLKKVPW